MPPPLEDSLIQYCKSIYLKGNPKHTENTFFTIWLREKGQALTFVFKKNLKVTNIQYAELITLVRHHIKDVESNHYEVQFLTVKEYIEKFSLLFNTLFSIEIFNDKKQFKITVKNFINLYESLFKSIVVVDAFYGTCGIFLPYNLKLDIEKVCFLSGYIHSCGANIYTRKIYKASENEFYERLNSHLVKTKANKTPFTLYCHEDFTPYDRGESPDFFNNGLDDIKFYVEKVFLGDTSMTTVLRNMQKDKRFKKSLDISLPGDYHINIKGKSEKSIWLISDKSINTLEPKPGPYKYLICYEQEYINENPFHIFDENKPGWIDHVTIPHTLMGAMINLGMCNVISPNNKISIFDPFVGSGTTLLELSKYENFSFEGSDISPLSKLVIQDNIDFFQLPKKELEEIEREFIIVKLLLLHPYTKSSQQSNSTKEKKRLTAEFNNCKEFLSPKTKYFNLKKYESMEISSQFNNVVYNLNILIKRENYKKDNQVFIKLSSLKNLKERIFFYVGLKTFKRKNKAIFERKTEIPTIAYLKELDDMILQIRNLKKLKFRLENRNRNVKTESECHNVYIGNFSKAVSLKLKRLSSNGFNYIINENKDVHNKFKELVAEGKKFHIIITDPPYGFNTKEENLKFSHLFRDMIEGMIKSISDYGQIIICLPEWSHTGKKMAYYTQRQLIIHQLIYFANKNNMDLISPYKLIPKPNWLFQPPYYWESEKALKRSIIHFTFRKK